MDRIDVHGRAPRALRHDRHPGPLAVERRVKLVLEGLQHGAHVAHRAIAEKRHRAMRHLALGLDLGPPDAAMAEADAVLVQRFGNDDVVDLGLREIALLRQIGDAAEAARFLVDRAGNLDRARKIRIDVHERLDGDDRGGEPALHVAGAAAIDLAVRDHAGEGIDRPAVAGLDDVDVRVEMDGRSARPAVEAGDDVDARIAVGVAGRAFGADEFDAEAALLQARGQVFGAGAVGVAGRIDRRKADQVGGQRREILGPLLDRSGKPVVHVGN